MRIVYLRTSEDTKNLLFQFDLYILLKTVEEILTKCFLQWKRCFCIWLEGFGKNAVVAIAAKNMNGWTAIITHVFNTLQGNDALIAACKIETFTAIFCFHAVEKPATFFKIDSNTGRMPAWERIVELQDIGRIDKCLPAIVYWSFYSCLPSNGRRHVHILYYKHTVVWCCRRGRMRQLRCNENYRWWMSQLSINLV